MVEKEQEILELRCLEAEKALQDCAAALELLPIEDLEKGLLWHPSEIALHLIKKASTSVADFGHAHWDTNISDI